MSNIAIGIHFGNTNSSIAVGKNLRRNGQIEVLKNNENEKLTPSFLYFSDIGVIVGKKAKTMAEINPELGIFDIKTLMRGEINDLKSSKYKNSYPFEIKSDIFGHFTVKLDSSNSKTISELCSMIFKQLKFDFEIQFLEKVDKLGTTVLTISANSTVEEHCILVQSAKLAGFSNIELIHEPIAIIKSHYHRAGISKVPTGCIIVCKLGGTTCETSIVEVDANSLRLRHSTSHEIYFDLALVGQICRMLIENQLDPSYNKRQMRHIFNKCEKVRERLSRENQVELHLQKPFFQRRIDIPVKTSAFENIILQDLQQCIDSIRGSVERVHHQKKKVMLIIVCGGSTRIPKLAQMCTNFFTNVPLHYIYINSDLCAAEGAAIRAAEISCEKLKGRGSAVAPNLQTIWEQ